MPWLIRKNKNQYCVHKENADGTAGERIPGGCHPSEAEAKRHMRALYANVEDAASKYFAMISVKAVGDWELDVLAVPFNERDSDGQWFDENTDIMEDDYKTPIGIYQHGIKQGGKELDERPIIVARAVPGSLEKRTDGWHVRYILDKSLKVAKDIMDAAWKKMVAVSSDSITHLARLDIGGKIIQYEKNRPGRIAVWPLAGVSMWEMGNGNFRPASRRTYALPAMKAIYRDAGLPFPEIPDATHGAPQADEMARKRAKVIENSKQLLKKSKYPINKGHKKLRS